MTNSTTTTAEPHSSFRGLMIVIALGLIPLSHCCPLFRQWLCGKAASGLERVLCGVLVIELQEGMDMCTGRANESVLKWLGLARIRVG